MPSRITPKPPLRISSALTVETKRGAFTGKRWMQLLASIGTMQSITAAAKVAGLSYKAAWDAVEAMNNLADSPLVERSVGGKGGGGTRLTARGEQLVATFGELEIENTRFLERINARIATAGQDIMLIRRLDMQTSARNQFGGQVVRIATGAINDEIELQLSGGDRLVAVITRESSENLGLVVGSPVTALIKASSIFVATHHGPTVQLSARNQLRGTISRVVPGAVNAEVVIALSGGNSIVAVITIASANTMRLVEGMAATAVFKASSVILAVAA